MIPLILIFRRKTEAVIGVEVQPSLAALARQNVSLNRFSSKIEIWEKDFKDLRERGIFDCVLCNPPYRRVGSGSVNPQEEKALARHEINATLEDVLRAAHHLLKNKGRFFLIYPASRTADLFQGLRRFHLEPKGCSSSIPVPEDDASARPGGGAQGGKDPGKFCPPLSFMNPEANTLRKQGTYFDNLFVRNLTTEHGEIC